MIQPVSKVKLLIVVPSLGCGGVERNVTIICNNIDTSRYDVTLAVLNNANQFFPISNNNIKIIDLQVANVRKSLFRILKLSKKTRPDIILTTANHLNLFFGIFKPLFSKRIRIIARESSIVSLNTQRTWNPMIYHWLLRVFYKRVNLIVCQSQYMQDDLVKNYNIKAEKTRIIHNAVVKPEIRATQTITGGFAELITVTRLSKDKGIDRLIRAVSLLKTPYRFTIIGEGRMRSPLQQLIQELSLQQKVFLPGRSEKPFTEVQNPDLFLMGSYYEGFPNAMLEAIAAGIPVVAFNAPGGISELMADNNNGILVEDNNEAVFAQSIQKALDKNFDKIKIQKFALEHFKIDGIMKQWYDLFDSVN